MRHRGKTINKCKYSALFMFPVLWGAFNLILGAIITFAVWVIDTGSMGKMHFVSNAIIIVVALVISITQIITVKAYKQNKSIKSVLILWALTILISQIVNILIQIVNIIIGIEDIYTILIMRQVFEVCAICIIVATIGMIKQDVFTIVISMILMIGYFIVKLVADFSIPISCIQNNELREIAVSQFYYYIVIIFMNIYLGINLSSVCKREFINIETIPK